MPTNNETRNNVVSTNSENSGVNNGISVSNGGTTPYVESCGAASLDPDGTRRFHDCEEFEGGFRCVCDGATSLFDGTNCEDALIAECGLSSRELEACSPVSGAICLPEADGSFTCQCDRDGEVFSAAGDTCRGAGWLACSDSCSVGPDSCTPVIDPEPGFYECECGYYQTIRAKYVAHSSCQQAASLLCQPGAFVDGCTGWRGFCDQAGTPEFGFECSCLDGTSEFVTPADLGGQDDCELALIRSCGDDTPPEGYFCQGAAGDRSGECVRAFDDQGNEVYRCDCRETSNMNGSAGGNTVVAADCEAALAEVCNL